ncbi:MAG: hypothetical protein DRN49_03035 [Thaumarchaeota archaeon]|nr:MAG: hypothetical protein DRN49_03035 [Nitrososphaerota archaeon]
MEKVVGRNIYLKILAVKGYACFVMSISIALSYYNAMEFSFRSPLKKILKFWIYHVSSHSTGSIFHGYKAGKL